MDRGHTQVETPNTCSNHTGFGRRRIQGLQSCNAFSLWLWQVNGMLVLDRLLIVIHIFAVVTSADREVYRQGRTSTGYQIQLVSKNPSFRMTEAPSGISMCQYPNAVLYPFPLRIYARHDLLIRQGHCLLRGHVV